MHGLAAITYFLTIDDGTYKEGDWSSTNYGAQAYSNSINVNSDGTLSNEMSMQELWDKMVKNGSRVDKYLSSPEELAKLIRAEVVTQYPDTRENPDKEINWDEIGEDDFQGIIKFKRVDESEKSTTMVYADPETFQGYIDEYNSTGSESAKKNALTHFTLKKSAVSTASNNETTVVAAGEGVMTDVSQKIIDAINNTPWPGESKCLQWVENVYKKAGLSVNSAETAYRSYEKNGISTDRSAIPVGAAVYGTGSGTAGGEYGHVGIYIGDGKVVDSVSTKVQTTTLDEWIGWQEKCAQNNYNILADLNGNNQHGWLGWGWADGNRTRGTTEDTSINKNNSNNDKKDESKNNTVQKSTETAVTRNVSGDGYKQEYTSSAGITYKLYRQFEGSYAENHYWDGTIHHSGCGPSSIAILASGLTNLNYTPGDIASHMNMTSYATLQKEMQDLGMSAEVIQSPSAETIQENLRNGKVMLVSVDSRTMFTGNSHIMTILDINTDGQVYIGNPGANETKNGWFDISKIMEGCQYIITTDAGAAGIANVTNTSGYVAVVATWKQIDTTLTTNDPNVEASSNTEYFMTTTNINYQEMVQSYTMPFDLLWAFLVIGEEKDFVFELADLVYGSDIQITIYDNLTVNTDINDWNYTQRTRAILKYYDIIAKFRDYQERKSGQNDIHDPYQEDNYNTVKTVVTQTNTVNAVLTRANVWVADYKNSCTYEVTEQPEQNQEVKEDDKEYPAQPDSTSDTFSCEHIEAIKKSLADEVMRKYKANASDVSSEAILSVTEVTYDESYYVEYYKKYANITNKITNKTTTKNYTTGVPDIREKTDASVDENNEPKELNFVTIFRKAEHIQNKKNTLSVPSWLFEIIETNDSTKDMLDLIKYLLYKATGNNYGVTEWSFDDLFAMKDSVIFGEISGSEAIEQIWNYFTSAGFTDEATAGILGNMSVETGGTFDPAITATPAAGLCMWENYPEKSRGWKCLDTFARKRGGKWSDLKCQLDYIVYDMPNEFNGYTGNGTHTYPDTGETVWWPEKMSADEFKKLTDVDLATEIFCKVFERPRKAGMKRRQGDARAIYKLYHK